MSDELQLLGSGRSLFGDGRRPHESAGDIESWTGRACLHQLAPGHLDTVSGASECMVVARSRQHRMRDVRRKRECRRVAWCCMAAFNHPRDGPIQATAGFGATERRRDD